MKLSGTVKGWGAGGHLCSSLGSCRVEICPLEAQKRVNERRWPDTTVCSVGGLRPRGQTCAKTLLPSAPHRIKCISSSRRLQIHSISLQILLMYDTQWEGEQNPEPQLTFSSACDPQPLRSAAVDLWGEFLLSVSSAGTFSDQGVTSVHQNWHWQRLCGHNYWS